MERHLEAPRERVYAALLDPQAVTRWRVPDGMACGVHEFEAVVGGTLRISLTYEGLPASVSPEDEETGWRQALDRLAALVEQDPGRTA